MNKILPIILVVVLSGCVAIGEQTLFPEQKIDAPKVISLNVSSGGPWMRDIERRLTRKGCKVLRSAGRSSVEITKEKNTSNETKETFNEAETRYYLEVDAMAPVNFARRCFGGGFNFDYIYADIIDTRTNQTIASIESRGYSEGCAPLSGSIFENITKMVVNSWAR